MTVQFEEQGNLDFTYKRDWEITEKIKKVSVRGRLKQNILKINKTYLKLKFIFDFMIN